MFAHLKLRAAPIDANALDASPTIASSAGAPERPEYIMAAALAGEPVVPARKCVNSRLPNSFLWALEVRSWELTGFFMGFSFGGVRCIEVSA